MIPTYSALEDFLFENIHLRAFIFTLIARAIYSKDKL